MKTVPEIGIHNRLVERHIPDSKEERRRTAASGRYAIKMVMNGQTASIGTATGRAAVVMNKSDMARIREDTVIISKVASQDLMTVISKACAMATEYGGQAASVLELARKYGIPAVVGVPRLMKAVKDGDLVRIDGINGTVEIMKRMQ